MSRPVVTFRGTILIVLIMLSGCGGEPYTYEPDYELKPGSGLFSGKDGEFTVIDSPGKNGAEQDTKQRQQETTRKL